MKRTHDQTRRETDDDSSGGEPQASPRCPACGAEARRGSAHFCATCGRGLRERAYAPADSLFSSYHQQHVRPALSFEHAAATSVEHAPRPTPPRSRLFASEGNTAAAIALVLVYSALVPFIGILFCPFAILIGGFGLIEARLVPGTGGVRLAVCCIVFGFLIAGAQVLLWQLF